jgi:6-phosphogluconolactonase
MEINRFDTELNLCRAVCDRWLRWLESKRPGIADSTSVALSGGRIAERLFPELAKATAPVRALAAEVDYYWADERCVAPTDPESNFNRANQLLLLPLGIPEFRIHRIRGEMPPREAAAEAEAEIARLAPLDPAGYPVIDLAMLGMGEDGHTASLFPPVEAMPNQRVPVYLHVTAQKPPPDRITLTYPCLALAREVWVLVTGAGKKSALAASLAYDSVTPLGRVLASRSMTRLFIHEPQSP